MIKTILVITLFLSSSLLQAQTKWIAHKSHSGSNSSFMSNNSASYGAGILESSKEYGPGVGRIEWDYERDTSSIQIQLQNELFPTILFDETRTSMKFYDVKDSLIGCDKPFVKYLSHGTVVYSLNEDKHFLYTTNPKVEMFDVSTKVKKWKKENALHKNYQYIYSKNMERILVNYPTLGWNHLQDFLAEMQIENEKVREPKVEIVEKTTLVEKPIEIEQPITDKPHAEKKSVSRNKNKSEKKLIRAEKKAEKQVQKNNTGLKSGLLIALILLITTIFIVKPSKKSSIDPK